MQNPHLVASQGLCTEAAMHNKHRISLAADLTKQLSAVCTYLHRLLLLTARKPEVMFLMSGKNIDQAERQRYRENTPDETRLLVITFKGHTIEGQGDVPKY